MYKPLVSIVMSAYNNSLYLREAIDSVLQQTYKNWEFIIINDASTDNTDEILKEYKKKDTRIVYVKNKENKGLTKSLNRGIDISKGEFIARVDGDDIWTDKTKLEQQVTFLQKNPKYGVVGCFAYAVETSGNKLFELRYPSKDKNIREIILKHPCLIHSALLIRKQVMNKIVRYDVEYLHAQDYDLFLKLGTISKLHNIPKFMVHYRINPNGISRTKYWEHHNEIIKIIKKYKNYYPDYFSGFILWNLRKFYPVWFRGSLSRQIKKSIPLFYKLSGA